MPFTNASIGVYDYCVSVLKLRVIPMSRSLIFIMTNDYKRYWGNIGSPMYAIELNNSGFYDYQRQTDIVVTNANNMFSCTKPFVFIWPFTNDRTERRRQYTILSNILNKSWLNFATNYGPQNLIMLYSWTYEFNKSSAQYKEETEFEEKYLKVNDKCFKKEYSKIGSNNPLLFYIKFLQGGGV